MRTTLMIVFTLLAVAEMVTGVITTENHRPQIKHVADACGFLAFGLAAGVWPTSSWAGVGALILGCAGIVAGVFLASSDERAAAADKRRLEESEANAMLTGANMDMVRAEATRLVEQESARGRNR